jgi:class 3 adenylate cyclase/DNA-binding SARP family transcriptional activator
MDVRWRIQLLGRLQATQGGRVVSRFRSQKYGLLLAYLAYHQHSSHAREELVELLWPEGDPDAGRLNLRVALSWLRQQLEFPGSPTQGVILADRVSVRLNPAAVTTDVAEFEATLKAAASAESSSERAAGLAQAVELCRGPLLPGYYEPWILQEREWLAGRYFQALGQLLGHLEQAGDLDQALQFAHRGVTADPLREEAHLALIRLYATAGQPEAALRQYRELERLLQEQLGAVPSPSTQTLAREIERQTLLHPPFSPIPPLVGRPSATCEARLTPAQGENRLVTVLFADMSHSVETTRDLHPEEAAALINRLLKVMVDVVLKYEGRIDHFLGDGMLAVFGTLRAHEDDPERAIRAALEIRESAQHLGLEVTAGINTGEVYVGAVGSEKHQEMTVVGPVVNLASRLQGQAEPGQLLVGETTYQLTRRAFEFSSLSLQIKGLTLPVTAYTVQRALPHPEKTRGIEGLRAELIGRDEELAKLKAALAAVLRGQGQMVTLIGEAGVGKSRLVGELKAAVGVQEAPPEHLNTRTPEHPPLWLEGRCLELSMTAGYSVFVDLFRNYFAWTPEEADRARGERLNACLREFIEQGDLTAEQAAEIGPLLGPLLSLRFGNEWDLRLKNASPEQIKHQTFMAVRDFLLALARRQPLLLVFEDLHWADSLSLDLISLLMETLSLTPIFLLCIYRPEREHKCWRLGSIAAQKCAGCYTELHLRELAPAQSRRLVESLLTLEALPVSVKELILEKSRGNPFFLEEVIRSLIDVGMLYREGEIWRAHAGIDDLAVPESVQSIILSRVDRLRPELKQVLQRASVMGRVFRRRLLEQTVIHHQQPVEEEPLTSEHRQLPPGLEAALWELEERALIYQERVVPEEEYSFRHVLTQETVYQSLLRRQRSVLHQRVAEAIEALYAPGLDEFYEQLAYHYERSSADEKAVEYLLKAGEKARRAYLNEEAIGYFQRTLERLETANSRRQTGDGSVAEPAPLPSPVCRLPSQLRLEALTGLGRIYHGIGREPEAEECFQQAIALGKEIGLTPRELARLHSWLGDLLWWQSRFDELIRAGEDGLALLGDDTESVEAVLMRDLIALGYVNKEGHTWREFADRNVPLIERLPYSEELRPAYIHVLEAYTESEKNIDKAIKWLRSLEQKAEQLHHLTALADVPRYIASITTDAGNLQEAILHRQRALELYTKIGDTKHQTMCLSNQARTYLSLGDLQRAVEFTQKGRELAGSVGSKMHRAELQMRHGTILLCESVLSTQEERWQEPARAFHEAVQLFRETGQFYLEAQATSSLGRVYLACGKRDEASRQFQKALVPERANIGAFAAALSGLEEAHDHPEKFRAFCDRFREEHPEVANLPFAQWFLEPGEPIGFSQQRVHDEFLAALSADWVWQDPFGDCSFTAQNGLEVHAANGRNLWRLNLSAPRLVRPAAGDFAIETVCGSVSGVKPSIGGLLLWKDRENFLRLDRGLSGEHEISLLGCRENNDLFIGRGRLASDRVFLRLERLDGRVNGLCSSDGQSWYTLGHAEFAVEDPVEVGVYAIGDIDRTVYPGAHPEGTAIRFEWFRLWC